MTLTPRPDSRETLDFTGVGCMLGGFVFAVGFAVMMQATKSAPDWFPARSVAWPLLLAICWWVQSRYVGYVWDNRKAKPWDDAAKRRDDRRARRIRIITAIAIAIGLVEVFFGFEAIARYELGAAFGMAWLVLGLSFVLLHVTWTMRAVERPHGSESTRVQREMRVDSACAAIVLSVLFLFLTPTSIYRFVWWNQDDLVELCAGRRPDSFRDWNVGGDRNEGTATFAWSGISELVLVYAPDGLEEPDEDEKASRRWMFGPWYYSIRD